MWNIFIDLKKYDLTERQRKLEGNFADTKGVIGSRKSKKVRQCNGQMKKDIRTNNDEQNTTQRKIKIE